MCGKHKIKQISRGILIKIATLHVSIHDLCMIQNKHSHNDWTLKSVKKTIFHCVVSRQ